MQFNVGDMAVYPSHGVGVIRTIESKEIGGEPYSFYVLEIVKSGAKLMVPTGSTQKAGMRCLISNPQIKNVYSILRGKGHISRTTWNRRFREFNDKLRTGSVEEIAEVWRDLNSLKNEKDLSFGEKKMLDRAKDLLVSEISAASSRAESEIEFELERILPH